MREVPGFVGSQNPQLSAMRISHPQRFIDIVTTAIVKNHGILQNAAEALKVHRNTLDRWLKKYPELRAVVEKAK